MSFFCTKGWNHWLMLLFGGYGPMEMLLLLCTYNKRSFTKMPIMPTSIYFEKPCLMKAKGLQYNATHRIIQKSCFLVSSCCGLPWCCVVGVICVLNLFWGEHWNWWYVFVSTSGSRGARGPGPPLTPRFGGPSYTVWRPHCKFKSKIMNFEALIFYFFKKFSTFLVCKDWSKVFLHTLLHKNINIFM